jgi:putative oxidoreductase
MKKFLFDCGTRDATASAGLFVLRASAGLMMLIGHGIPKFRNYDSVVQKWHNLPEQIGLSFLSPQVAVMGAIAGELVAAALLILGLMTRPAAFLFGFAMVTAAFGYHGADPMFFSPEKASKELAVMYLIPAVVILITGAGSWSIDSSLYHDSKRRRW